MKKTHKEAAILYGFSFFDVETPSRYQDSICQIAIISETSEKPVVIDHLVDPQDDFHPVNVSIHGISKRAVYGKPTFPDIWPDIAGYFKDRIVVGHNVKFDLSVLYKNIYHYGFEPFDIYYIDTMDLLRSKKLECGLGLKESCKYFNIRLDGHHDALVDTRAARDLFHVLSKEVPTLNAFIKKYIPGDRCYGYKRELFRNNPKFSRKPPVVRVNQTTQKIIEMKNLLMSISADQEISHLEMFRLRDWLTANEQLNGNFPFDAISATVTRILADGLISRQEQGELLDLINHFLNPGNAPKLSPNEQLTFNGQVVCLTGDFYYGSKPDVEKLIQRQRGTISNTVTKKTSMIIIGSLGSPRWSYGTFGSKVKKALELKDNGQDIQIIHEDDIKLGEAQ